MHFREWIAHHWHREPPPCNDCGGLSDETRNALDEIKYRLDEVIRIERDENIVESEIWGNQRPPRRRPMR